MSRRHSRGPTCRTRRAASRSSGTTRPAAPAAGRFVPGKNTLGMHWLGPCSPKGNAPQHYVMTLIATTVEPGELPAGLTKPELLKALEGGKALRAASLVLRFAQ